MYEQLKNDVFKANLDLPKYGLVTFTWGNASQKDESGAIAIKPSGVEYDAMTADDMVIVGAVGQGSSYAPSSDTPTHIEIYKAFPQIGGIVHTHSRWATVFAQAGLDIPALGTTHADTFFGAVPCTRELRFDEIKGDYEAATGRLIVETFLNRDINPLEVPAVLVRGHGPFVFGKTADEAAHNAAVLEEVAFMAWHTLSINPDICEIKKELLDRHYLRKHGSNAYYGQKGLNK